MVNADNILHTPVENELNRCVENVSFCEKLSSKPVSKKSINRRRDLRRVEIVKPVHTNPLLCTQVLRI